MRPLWLLHKKYQSFRPFTEPEAWALFKTAAIAEAVGWTALIIGIYYRDYVLHGTNWPVAVAGQIHGTLFLTYIAAAALLGPSLEWPLWRSILAGICSVPPYGSLMYEVISERLRNRQHLQRLYRTIHYHHLLTPLAEQTT